MNQLTATAYVSKVSIGGIPAGTEVSYSANGKPFIAAPFGNVVILSETDLASELLFEKKEPVCACDQAKVAEEPQSPIDETPAFNVGAVLDSEAFGKIQSGIRGQAAIADGEKYFFYLASEKRWAKATMERTSSDLGRLMSGFAIPLNATVKRKRNRLNNLNSAYGLGLTSEEINDIANA